MAVRLASSSPLLPHPAGVPDDKLASRVLRYPSLLGFSEELLQRKCNALAATMGEEAAQTILCMRLDVLVGVEQRAALNIAALQQQFGLSPDQAVGILCANICLLKFNMQSGATAAKLRARVEFWKQACGLSTAGELCVCMCGVGWGLCPMAAGWLVMGAVVATPIGLLAFPPQARLQSVAPRCCTKACAHWHHVWRSTSCSSLARRFQAAPRCNAATMPSASGASWTRGSLLHSRQAGWPAKRGRLCASMRASSRSGSAEPLGSLLPALSPLACQQVLHCFPSLLVTKCETDIATQSEQDKKMAGGC